MEKIDPNGYYSQMAAQVLGGISVGIYQESLPEQIVYYLNDCKARIVVVEDQEQVDKLLEIEEQIPLVEHIIFYNKQGMRHYKHPKLTYFEDVLMTGQSLGKDRTNFYCEKLSVRSGKIMLLLHTVQQQPVIRKV